ncbi:MAG: dephospho-CoA kinase [Planctomycetaceae bacterium]|nr:dephospho-CoA kinase [Planctomycetaceae bacterium]
MSIRDANVPVIGLIGGIASGKSVVAAELARLGAAILDADRAGHEVLALPDVATAIDARWGRQVRDAEGNLDRRALGRIVFAPGPAGERELEFLEQLTHPRIGELLMRQVAGLIADGARALVLDAPVMEKSGWYGLCDRIVYVDAPREVRLARARQRGWTEEEFVAREGAQESLEQKRGRADLVIDNSGSLDGTRAQVERWWQTLFD